MFPEACTLTKIWEREEIELVQLMINEIRNFNLLNLKDEEQGCL